MIEFIKKMFGRINRKEMALVLIFTAAIAAMAFMPTGFEKQIYMNAEGVKAKVVAVDNSYIYKTGLISQGEQQCSIEILSGSHKGERVPGVNMLVGKQEFDKIFSVGDTAWVLLEFDDADQEHIIFANMVDHYRFNKEWLLIGIFAVLAIAVSGCTGVRTLLSFAFALMSIWKILIPMILKGYDPLLTALVIGNVLTVTTLLLVAGFTRKAAAAIASAMACSLATALLAVAFSRYFKIDGTVMQWSESLLYAGYMHLDLTAVFQAAVYLACSGAILDLAIDISAALEEVVRNNPKVSRIELVKSGMAIGRSVVGSQTTTLLLAYMGSYISVMMVYAAQGTPLANILTSKAIAAEILHTFVGCIGLVLVSPLTASISGFLFTGEKMRVVSRKILS